MHATALEIRPRIKAGGVISAPDWIGASLEAAEKLDLGQALFIASLQDAELLLSLVPGLPPRFAPRPPRTIFTSSLRDEIAAV